MEVVTVEFEVCYRRERGAAGESLALIFSLGWEDVSAQITTIILGDIRGKEKRQVGGSHHPQLSRKSAWAQEGQPLTCVFMWFFKNLNF